MDDYLRIGAMLGLMPEEIWKMTPREFKIISEGWEKQQEVLDRRAAQVVAAIYEQNRNKKKRSKPFSVQDFMPQKGKKQSKEQTPEQMLSVLKAMFGHQKGR